MEAFVQVVGGCMCGGVSGPDFIFSPSQPGYPSVSRVKVHSLLLEVRTGLPVPAAASLASSWFQTGQSPGGVGTGQNAVDSFSLSGV